MFGLVIALVVLLCVYLSQVRIVGIFFSAVLLFFVSAVSASWVALVVCGCLILGGLIFAIARTELAARPRVLAVILAIGILLASVPAGSRAWKRVQLRNKFSYASIENRLQPVNETKYLVAETGVDSEEFRSPLWWQSRARSIEALHRSAVFHFLETPEFGVIRMAYPSLRILEEPDGSPILLPDDFAREERGEQNRYPLLGTDTTVDARIQGQLRQDHVTFRNWFLDPNRFGSVQDVDQVAGFLPHAMTDNKRSPFHPKDVLSEPFGKFSLKLQRLQLVGLLFHAEPVVYVLDTLPELLSAGTAPTRPLDEFESRGLNQLIEGETIHFERSGATVHMLGALRNAGSCVSCHPGPTNQLLGAFSYELVATHENAATLTSVRWDGVE